MRLVSIHQDDGTGAAIARGDRVLPLHETLDEAQPVSMLDALARWERIRNDLNSAPDLGQGAPLEDVDLAAPVPRPPSVRDFYAFEEHVSRSWKRRGESIPDAWYEVPVFYFSNPASIVGPEDPIRKPSTTDELDFELEVGWVIGERAANVDPSHAEEAIAGLTIMNDFSARDVQRREMSVGLGPSKGKDFATALGPALVTLDELVDLREGGHFDLEMRARVNGTKISEGNLADLEYSLAEMTAHASRDTVLQPGDVMGTGTVGTGCYLDLGTGDWLEPGDVIELEVEKLGTLRNRITGDT